jgi:hypothetical protein
MQDFKLNVLSAERNSNEVHITYCLLLSFDKSNSLIGNSTIFNKTDLHRFCTVCLIWLTH